MLSGFQFLQYIQVIFTVCVVLSSCRYMKAAMFIQKLQNFQNHQTLVTTISMQITSPKFMLTLQICMFFFFPGQGLKLQTSEIERGKMENKIPPVFLSIEVEECRLKKWSLSGLHERTGLLDRMTDLTEHNCKTIDTSLRHVLYFSQVFRCMAGV